VKTRLPKSCLVDRFRQYVRYHRQDGRPRITWVVAMVAIKFPMQVGILLCLQVRLTWVINEHWSQYSHPMVDDRAPFSQN
jgi:hypothetical protein